MGSVSDYAPHKLTSLMKTTTEEIREKLAKFILDPEQLEKAVRAMVKILREV